MIISLLFQSNINANQMRIAVMDFKAAGVSKNIAERVAELIRNRMINIGKFVIVERKQMRDILKEQGLQRTGCTDNECAVKIGKLLSANKMLIGTIMEIGGKIIITGRIVDVEKGIGEFSQDQEASSKMELYNAVKLFTDNLAMRIQEKNNQRMVTTHNYENKINKQSTSQTYDTNQDLGFMFSTVYTFNQKIKYSEIYNRDDKEGTYSYDDEKSFAFGIDYFYLLNNFDIGFGLKYYTKKQISGEPINSFSNDSINNNTIHYRIIPYYAGMRYGWRINSLRPYVIGQLGLSFIIIDEQRIKSSSNSLHVAAGTGLILSDKIFFEILYSRSTIELKNDVLVDYHYETSKAELTYDYITISVGYNFL